MPHDQADDEPCLHTPEDGPFDWDGWRKGPDCPIWWKGHWPEGGIKSLGDLEAWITDRLDDVVHLYGQPSDSLKRVATMTGIQTISNAIRYLARNGPEGYPPRPSRDKLDQIDTIESSLEDLLRFLRTQRTSLSERKPDEPKSSLIAVGSLKPEDQDSTQPPPRREDVRTPPDPTKLVLDSATFSAQWGGLTCPLGNTNLFRVLELLSRFPGTFVTVQLLFDDVWRDRDLNPNTLHKTVSNLRAKLREAGMGSILIEAEEGHYRVKLPEGI